ncbi:hypothetical protein [Photobacterium alginatilyticum]|uniref:Uncharacterized protein n=1 Tax=Photobacterium alginatilyticum TaxID=1775171 RepID=A0ABW9YR23_9GAMM|nr:hypothetical protein [Photobacterium alginatilyticum]NBI56311.1 hypothetical protein [Photobacterium alginatilyticum]
MSKYRKILEFYRPEFLTDLQVSRLQDQGLLKVWMQVETDEERNSVELSGFDELAEAVSYLLLADHVLISEEVGTGKEFGTIRIRCRVDDCYSEFWCDTATV